MSNSELTADRQYSAEEFWSARPLLQRIKWWSSYLTKSPYAILVWVMVQMLARIPYDTQYVTKVGGNSLNLTFVISGNTGTGKTAARKLASLGKIVNFLGTYWSAVPLVQPRSGESVGDSFYIRVKVSNEDGTETWKDEWINLNHAVIFFYDEVLFFNGKQRQNSSTLASVFLSLWSCEMLGGALAGGKGKTVEADSYRAVSVFHSQLENDPFRSDVASYSGETSRVLTVSSTNPNARKDLEQVKGQLEPAPFDIPRFGGVGDRATPQFRALPEMEAAQEEQDLAASEGTHDRGRSHEVLQRSKIACVLAALDGRTNLVIEDWHLAGHLIDHSREMDKAIRKAQNTAARKEAGKSGALLGLRMGAADETKEEYAIERVGRLLRKWAPEVGYDLTLPPSHPSNISTLGALSGKLSSRNRFLIDAALESIINKQTIEKKEK